MKKEIASSLFTLVFICILQTYVSAQSSYLDVGTEVSVYPKVTWLKGEPVEKFNKDKIYVVELWATWCLPCIANMPHINELAKKFSDKNIIFIGQNVMEDDLTKVSKFVTQKGDGMSYRVAFAGMKESPFDKEWIKPAGVTTLPQTYIIKDNKLIWLTTPNMINEKVLQLIIDDKFTIKAATELTRSTH